MNAAARPAAAEDSQLQPMRLADLDEVMAIEQAAYPFPWTRGNFVDSLAAGYRAWTLRGSDGRLIGYFLALQGVAEMHLLNITVAPEQQGRGHARRLLDALCALANAERCEQIWLEVRESNARARAVYAAYGFAQTGRRRAYYPAAAGQREDAVLMSLELQGVER
jgi:ribosomal-protein-alanine N-acetyltransferase